MTEELKLNLQGLEIVGESNNDSNRTLVIEPLEEVTLLLRWTSNEVSMTPEFTLISEMIIGDEQLKSLIRKDGKLKEFEPGAGCLI